MKRCKRKGIIMPNTIADLNKRISDKKCTGLFVFYGEEDALKTHKINTIKKQLLEFYQI